MRKIAVVGAGITGVTTAYALLNRGFDVTVFDKNRYAAMETSFANGGQLSASNAEVWTQWSTIFKGLKWMTQRGAPLLVNPMPSWHKYSWMAEFMANIPNYKANTIETAAKVNDLLAQGGLERHAVTAQDMKTIEPALRGDLYGGYYTESDFTGDIHAYAKGLGEACKRRGGVFQYGAHVDSLVRDPIGGVTINWTDMANTQSDHFDGIVICAGVRSRDLAAMVGDRVNIYPVKGYSITVQLDDADSQQAAPWVSLLDDKAKIVTSRLGTTKFRVAGTAEFNGYNKDIRDDRIAPLTKWVENLFPDVSTEHAIPWAGLRPMMPNMMPRVGAGKSPGVFYNTGHGHLGWTLSAATSEMVADEILMASRQSISSMAAQ